MEEYIKKLLEQVRFQKAHKAIQDEIRAHIEDQIKANIADGMDRETAEKQAVIDMGDPVEAGISLDAVHRPLMAWGIVLAAVIVGVIGSLIHMFMMQDAVRSGKEVFVGDGGGFILFTVIGIISMLFVYLLDYTVIARYSKIAAIPIFLALFFAGDELGIIAVVGHVSISSSSLMLLLIPLYGGILYSFRGGKFGALLKALLWILIPGYLVFWYDHKNIGMVFVVSMLVQLTIAIIKGWIKVPKMPVIAAIWSAFTLFPIAWIWIMYIFGRLATYQIYRLKFILNADSEAYYLGWKIREMFESIDLFGGNSAEIIGVIPDPDNHYILTYIVTTWGIIAGLMVFFAVCGLIVYGFVVSSKSKNQLGLVMGSGCMMALAVNAAFNICEGFAIMPFFSSFLPFISSGGSNLIVSYVFLGMIMSIYKYKNIYPEHIEIKKRQINFKIQI